MHDPVEHGLSRRQLEYHLQWLLRHKPRDPDKLIDFLGGVVVTLIEKNNAALAKAALEDKRVDLPEGA